MTHRKVFDKLNPTENNTHYYIPFPSDLLHYVHHDLITPDKLFLYGLIVDFYNPKDGYAFPSVDRLSLSYGRSHNTTDRHLEDLRKVGLIDFPEKGYYVPLRPLTEEEFYKEHPKAWENYKESLERFETRRKASVIRMQEWRKSNGYT